MVFEAPTLLTLVRVNASQAAPVRDLRFSGIGFKDSAASFLEPHSVPSAGDWALERVAALFFEGVERLVIENCTLSRAGGNGIMISGYSRDAVLHNNTVRWTGGSALAAWGRTDELSQGGALGWDATSGDFPQRTLVSSNLVTEVGVWEKQSSCWFQAKAALTELVGNVCFNGGRAGFNFNVSLLFASPAARGAICELTATTLVLTSASSTPPIANRMASAAATRSTATPSST